MNLRNRIGEERRRQTLCDSVTIILFEITLLHLPLNRCFCKDQKTLMLSEDHDITTQLIALSRLSHTSVLPFSSFCRLTINLCRVPSCRVSQQLSVILSQCAFPIITFSYLKKMNKAVVSRGYLSEVTFYHRCVLT